MQQLNPSIFFNSDPREVAPNVLGKLISHKYKKLWLTCRITDVEVYMLSEKGSHSSLGFSEKKQALFAAAGTIYMYYARGNDSFNVSCKGEGNAMLIKSAYPVIRYTSSEIDQMKKLNLKNGKIRQIDDLCSGQTLLCRSLNLKVSDWNNRHFSKNKLEFLDDGYRTNTYIISRRLGIPIGRDDDLLLRYTDLSFAKSSSKNPIRKGQVENRDYMIKSSQI